MITWSLCITASWAVQIHFTKQHTTSLFVSPYGLAPGVFNGASPPACLSICMSFPPCLFLSLSFFIPLSSNAISLPVASQLSPCPLLLELSAFQHFFLLEQPSELRSRTERRRERSSTWSLWQSKHTVNQLQHHHTSASISTSDYSLIERAADNG
jgi:hypothetical protein